MATAPKVDSDAVAAATKRAHAEAVINLADVFKKLIDEATDSAALKTQKNVAEKKLEMRAAEYLKSKPHHEKFPSTEESQRRAKEQAEKEFKVVDEKFKAKNSSLSNLAAEAAASVLPSILGTAAVDHDEQHKWQNRCEDLEKTCVTLKKQLEDQRKFLEGEKKLRLQLEGKFEAVDAKYKNAQASWAETKGRQASFDKDIRPQMQERLLDSEMKIESLKEDITNLSARFAYQKAQIPSDLPQKLEKVDSLSKRLDDLSNFTTGFSKVEEESAKMAQIFAEKSKAFEKVDRLELVVMGNGTENVPNLRATCLQLAKDQENFRTELKKVPDLEARVINVENRPASATYYDKLKELERTSSLQKLQSETHSALAAKVMVIESGQLDVNHKFEQRLGALEAAKATTPLFAGKPTTPDSNLISRVRSLEDCVKSIESIEKRVSYCETAAESCVNISELANMKSEVAETRAVIGVLEKAQNDLSSKLLEDRVDPIELEKRLGSIAVSVNASLDSRLDILGEHPSAAQGTAAPANANLLSRLDTLREDFESFKCSQLAADDSTAECLNIATNTAVNLQTRVVTAESKISQLETVTMSYKPLLELPVKFESLVEDQVRSVQQYQSVLNSARQTIVADSVSEAIKAIQTNPDVLPSATLETRVMNSIGQLNNKIGELDNRVEGNSLAVLDFEKRWQGINTRDMSNYILGQLSETYPNVRDAQAQLVALDTSLRNTQNQLIVLDSSFQGLQAQVQKLENRPQQSPAPSEGGRVSSLRKDVDKVTEDLMKEQKTARSAAKEAKECKDALSSLQDDYAKLHLDVAHTLGELHVKFDELKETDIANLDRRVNNLRDNEIAQLESRFNSLKDNEQALAQQIANLNKVPTASPAPSNASRSTATANGIKTHKVLQAPFSPPAVPTNRQASMESSTSSKRRKIVNGTAASRINGVNGRARSGSNTSSPQKRRRRRSDVTSDHDDPDYEIPQPGVSSDDEE